MNLYHLQEVLCRESYIAFSGKGDAWSLIFYFLKKKTSWRWCRKSYCVFSRKSGSL